MSASHSRCAGYGPGRILPEAGGPSGVLIGHPGGTAIARPQPFGGRPELAVVNTDRLERMLNSLSRPAQLLAPCLAAGGTQVQRDRMQRLGRGAARGACRERPEPP